MKTNKLMLNNLINAYDNGDVEVGRHTIKKADADKIVSILCLDEMSGGQLQNIRDMAVFMLDDDYYSLMSATTHMIDNRLMQFGLLY